MVQTWLLFSSETRDDHVVYFEIFYPGMQQQDELYRQKLGVEGVAVRGKNHAQKSSWVWFGFLIWRMTNLQNILGVKGGGVLP